MRRRQSALKDTRELVHVPGIGTMTCDAYKAGGAVPTMRFVDSMPPEWRALVHEFGPDADELYLRRIPQTTRERGITAEDARRRLESRRVR